MTPDDHANRALPGRALVLGGSGGVGAATCRALARDGWRVVVAYRSRRSSALAVAESITDDGGEASVLAVDLRDDDATSTAVRGLADDPIGAVVYAAGPVFPFVYVSETSTAQYADFLAADTMACFHAVSAALPQLRATRGAVVAVSSSAVSRTARKDVLSAVPKAANDALVRAVAAEEGRHGVRANSVAVGLLEGEGMWASFRESGEYDDAVLEPIRRSLPLRRFGSVTDVAEAAAFLASPRADWITGQTLHVDGGFSM